jgi:thiol-disulfide isomerase/thioredoxin
MALVYTPQNSDWNLSCPDFTLPGMDNQNYSLKDFQNQHPLVIMFICNHCPYVKSIEDRLIQLGLDLKKENINVVAICSNDPSKYTEDLFENLQKRYYEKKYSFYYLHDETQEIAKKFGAVCTPDFFLYDQNLKLKYRGRLDDSWKDPQLVTQRELYQAAIDLKNLQPISFHQTPSMGCSMKWKVINHD